MTITGYILAHAGRRSAALLSAVLIMASLAGCSENIKDGPDTPPGREPQIYLDLAVKAVENLADDARSRAEGDYSFEEPTLQNEKLNSLEVIIIDKSEKKVEHHRYVEYDERGNIKYSDNLRFPVTSGDKKIYLFGNTGSLPGPVVDRIRSYTKGVGYDPENNPEFETMTVTRENGKPYLTSRNNIPMSEAFDITVDPIADDESNRFQQQHLFVTRLATKFTIRIDKKYYDEYQFSTVRLDKMATKQYVLPFETVYNPIKTNTGQTIGGVTGRNITGFDSPADNNNSEFGLQLGRSTATKEIDGIQMYEFAPVYLMETPGEEFKLAIQFQNGDWSEWKKLNNLPLLPRNTHVIIQIKNTHGNLTMEVVLQPYKEVILEPGFGLDVPKKDKDPKPEEGTGTGN